jgi:hypothetical protein
MLFWSRLNPWLSWFVLDSLRYFSSFFAHNSKTWLQVPGGTAERPRNCATKWPDFDHIMEVFFYSAWRMVWQLRPHKWSQIKTICQQRRVHNFLTSFFNSSDPQDKEIITATKDLILAYHTAAYGFRFKMVDCRSKPICYSTRSEVPWSWNC